MASSLEFIETRLVNVEKQIESILRQLNGTVSEAAIQRLTALRQSDILELKSEVARLKQIVTNLMNNP